MHPQTLYPDTHGLDKKGTRRQMLISGIPRGIVDISNAHRHTAARRIHAGTRPKQLFLHAATPPAIRTTESGKRVLVTGSSGHLGEALVCTLRARGASVVGLDFRPSSTTNVVGSVTDP